MAEFCEHPVVMPIAISTRAIIEYACIWSSVFHIELFFMLIPCSEDYFRMSGIVRSIRFDAADYSVEQGAVKKEVISGLHLYVLRIISHHSDCFTLNSPALTHQRPNYLQEIGIHHRIPALPLACLTFVAARDVMEPLFDRSLLSLVSGASLRLP